MPSELFDTVTRGLAGVALLADYIVSAVYLVKNRNDLSHPLIYKIALFITPVIYQLLAMYLLYPDHAKTFSQNTKELKETWRDSIDSHFKANIHKVIERIGGMNAGRKPFFILLYAVTAIPFLMVWTVSAMINVIPAILVVLITSGIEFCFWAAYSLYVTGVFLLKLLNVVDYDTLSECTRSSSRFGELSPNRVGWGIILINTIQAICTTVPLFALKAQATLNNEDVTAWQLGLPLLGLTAIGLQTLATYAYKTKKTNPYQQAMSGVLDTV